MTGPADAGYIKIKANLSPFELNWDLAELGNIPCCTLWGPVALSLPLFTSLCLCLMVFSRPELSLLSESYPEGLSWSEGGLADKLVLINFLWKCTDMFLAGSG